MTSMSADAPELRPEDGRVEILHDHEEVFEDETPPSEAAGVDSAPGVAAAGGPMVGAQGRRELDAAHVDLVVNWNSSKRRAVSYSPPPGWVIERTHPVVQSKNGRAGYKIDTKPHLVVLECWARGNNEWWDKKRAWIKMYVRVTIRTA